MRSILKHIVLFVCLAATLPIFSQNPGTTGQPITAKGVFLNKEVSQETDDNGQYWITLDAFVTGTTVQKEVNVPCDIALVLDISSSMKNSVGTIRNYSEMSSASFSYNGLANKSYYYKDGDEYYLVQRERTTIANYYYLYFEVDGTPYYLRNDKTSPNMEKPTIYNKSTTTIWTGQLYKNSNSWSPERSTDYSYDGYGRKSYYYAYNGKRYKVIRGHDESYCYALYYQKEDNGTKYYLTSNGVITTAPTNITDATTPIWTGVLYISTSTTKTRIEALKEATEAFIETVAVKAKGTDGVFGMVDNKTDDVAHQISIITFDGLAYTNVGFTLVDSDENVDLLKGTVSDLTLGAGTCSDLGLDSARVQFAKLPAERKEVSTKVVVMFTDGAPYAGSKRTDGINSSDGVRNNAIAISHDLKSTYNALVYTVGVFETPLAEGTDNAKYMHYTSSEYPDAESMTSPGDKRTDGKVFYQYSDGTDLTSIFTSIAEASSTSDSSLGVESMVVIDVMSANFRLPNEVLSDLTKIKTYTVDCVGVPADASGSHTFATKENGEEDRVPFDAAIAVGKDASDNDKVTISNFDFAANFCGLHENDDKQLVPGGKKLVITFPIETSPQNPGGATLYTNTPESGIYTTADNEPVATFVQPILTLPNIIIRAQGLKNIGESATYTIYKINTKPIPDGEGGFTYEKYDDTKILGKDAYTPITVILTKTSSADPMAQIKLNEEGRYMVVESSWTEGYEPKALEQYGANEDTRTNQTNKNTTNKVNDTTLIRTICKGTESNTATDETYVDRGIGTLFVYDHSVKEGLNTARFDESAVVNVFKAGVSPKSYNSDTAADDTNGGSGSGIQ